MVERLAAAIISRPSILKLPLNSMTRRPFPTDFFSPIPRQRKGKEKAVESPFVECSPCCAASSASSCISRHSPWCPIRNRLFMMNHVIPRRSQPPSQSPQRCTRRHSSSAARTLSSQTRLLDRSQPVHIPREPEGPADKLRSLLATRTPFDPEHAWCLYVRSVQADAADSILGPGERLKFIRHLCALFEPCADAPPDFSSLHSWGTRLEPVLRELNSQLDVQSPEFVSLKCCTAQVHAWLGDVAQASQLARETRETPLSPSEKYALLCVYRSILLLLYHREGVLHALELLLREWNFFGPFFSLRTTSPQAASFRNAVHSLLAHIPDGARLLLSRSQVDHHDRLRTGTLLLEAYCAKELLHQAHALALEMRRQRLPIPLHFRSKLIRLLAQRNLFVLAHEIFESMDLSADPRLYYSTGLYLYARRGDVDNAEQFFAKHDENKWSLPFARCMLMHAYAVAGKIETVVELFHKFFPTTLEGDFFAERPGLTHYTTVLLAFAKLGDFDGIDLWLKKMLQAGCRPDGHVYSIILQCIARHGDADSVAATLDQMCAAKIKPDRVHYTTVITLFARKKHAAAAEAVYLRALREGIVPDRIMITSLMNAHVEAGSWEGVVRIFDYLRRSSRFRHDLPIEVYNTLLKAYVLVGTPFRVVLAIFRKLTQIGLRPDGYTYALVIQSACDAGKMDVAEELFAEMEKRAKSLGPLHHLDAYVLTIIMAGHVRRQSNARAKACYEDIQRRGIKPGSIIYRQIIQAYANDRTEESLKIAESFLKRIMDGDAIDPGWTGTESRPSALGNLFSPLMLVYARKEKPKEVVRLFNGMLEAGGEPSLESLTILMDVHRRAHNIDVVRQLWPQIWTLALRRSYTDELFEGDSTPIRRGSNLLCMPLSIYIDALSVAGEHDAVFDIWTRAKTEGFSFDAHNWNHLAVVLVRAGELDRAFEVLERVLIPHSHKDPAIRDPWPESPLVFDGIAPDVDVPASDAPMRRKVRRAKAVKAATKTMGSMLTTSDDLADFAHPLYILHQVIPGLSMWRPHAVTLHVLSKVLRHLQRGRLVQPIHAPNAQSATPQGHQSQAELARATLQRIYRNYPGAVRAVLLYERGQARHDAIRRSARQWTKVKGHVVGTLADEDTIGLHDE